MTSMRNGADQNRSRDVPVGVAASIRTAASTSPGTLVAILGLTLSSAAAHTAVPLTLKWVIDAVSTGSVVVPLATLASLALFAALASSAAGQIVAAHGEAVVAATRARLAEHVVHLHRRTAGSLGHGTLVARMVSDTAQFRTPLELGLTQIPAATTTLAISLVVMCWLDPVLLLSVAVVFAVFGLLLSRVFAAIGAHSSEQQNHVAVLANKMSQVLTAGGIIRSYGRRNEAARDMSAPIDDARSSATAVARHQSTIGPTLEFAQQISLLAVLVLGVARINSGQLEFSSLAAFLLYLFQLVAPLSTLGTALGRAAAVRAAQERIATLLALPREDEEPRLTPVTTPGVNARFRDVGVDIGGTSILENVDFDVPSTGITALVGPSGSGKSTVFSTLLGTETVVRGEVAVVDSAPCSSIAYVDQDATIYPGTLRQNLLLGRDDEPDDAELTEALAMVGLDHLPERLEGGLDSDLSGVSPLSGGERQRLSLARAVLSRRPLVLADEPTAHLDARNEKAVHDILVGIARDRAVLMITHRPDGLSRADHVVEMREGRSVPSQSHTPARPA